LRTRKRRLLPAFLIVRLALGEATTRVTEDIKSEFAQRDWREREQLTVMRGKLEEALNAAQAVKEQTSLGRSQTTNRKVIGSLGVETSRARCIAPWSGRDSALGR